MGAKATVSTNKVLSLPASNRDAPNLLCELVCNFLHLVLESVPIVLRQRLCVQCQQLSNIYRTTHIASNARPTNLVFLDFVHVGLPDIADLRLDALSLKIADITQL